ncbi:LuxR C-terminal-related transcriptional regulator [Streptomyces cucumeris]|uniref:helix-turn-helix transcriptional regulator n=1 Tax=Streptomyces cucumeris TaxID=2962890 RepID=UPI003EBD15CC
MATAVPAAPSPPPPYSGGPPPSSPDEAQALHTVGLTSEPPLVGRERELTAGLTVLSRRHGPGGVLLTGPAGIGKTRLGGELAAAIMTPHPGSASAAGAGAGAGAGVVTGVDELAPGGVLPTVQRLLCATARRPRLLWIDDAHLLPPQAIEPLLLLLRRRGDKMLLTVNPDEAPPHLHALWKDQHLARVDLPPLDVPASRRLAGALLEDRLAQTGVARLARMSAGNPLLLRELVRAALAQGVLRQDGGWWHLDDALPTSDALRDLADRRLRPLGTESRRALELIALAEPARLDVLETLVGLPTLLDLEDQGLIQAPDPRRRAAEADAASVRIAHPYLGQVLRQGVAPLRRKHYLRTWTGALPGPGARPPAERILLAQWHLDAGDVPAQETLLEAAQDALRAHELPTADRLATAAWDHFGTAEAAEMRARTLLARAEFGELHTFVAAVRAEHREYGTVLDPVRARAFVFQGRPHEAEEMATGLPEADAALINGMVCFFRGHFGAALEHCSPLLRAPLPTHRLESGLFAMATLCYQGRPTEALEHYRRLRDDTELHTSIAWPLIQDSLEELHAVALLFSGRLEEAEILLTREYHAATREYATRVDAQRGLSLGAVLYERGRPRQALAFLTFTPAYQVGWQPWEAMSRVYSALAMSCLPPGAAGPADGPAGAAGSEDALDGLFGGHCRGALRLAHARRAHHTGDVKGATRFLHEAVEDALSHHGYADVVAVLHECARLGLEQHPAVHHDHPVQGPLLRARLLYARAVADGDAKLLGQAARTMAESGAHLYAAEGYAELARLHHRAGRDRAATAATAQARTLLKRCDDVVTPPLDFLGESAPLSARERTVARLAAQGLTDKEIAGQLVISPRTVSNTLYRIYQKIGATDRRHLRRLLSA